MLMSNYPALILTSWPCRVTHSQTPHTADNDEKQEGTRMHIKKAAEEHPPTRLCSGPAPGHQLIETKPAGKSFNKSPLPGKK